MNTDIVNVARFLPLQAKEMPDACAVKVPLWDAGCETLSFDGLNRESSAAAFLLKQKGIVRGDKVLLMVRPGLELIALTFALFRMGAVPVVIDPGMGVPNLVRSVRSVKPDALVGIPLALRLSRILFPAFRSLKVRVEVKEGAFRLELASIIKSGDWEKGAAFAETKGDELAAILFTSGSTGAPKGVCYEHAMFEAQVRLIKEQYGIQPGEVDLPMLPIFALFNPALGMTTVVPEMNPSRPAMVDPQKIVRAIVDHGVTSSFGSPVLWRKIGRHCERSGLQLPGIKRVLMAGAPVTPGTLRILEKVLPNAELHTPYGATEALPVSSISKDEILKTTWGQTESGSGTCVGRPFPGVSVKVIPETQGAVIYMGDTVRPGQVGEIVVQGPSVTREYCNKSEATQLAKIKEADGFWHRMGDLGYLDDEGRLWFCGRKAECVHTDHGAFYTDCCEGVFNALDGIYRTALIGIKNRGELKPAIVVEPDTWPLSKEAKAALLEKLRICSCAHVHTHAIDTFFFQEKFPVDVRHNAKIHRLTLARKWGKKRP